MFDMNKLTGAIPEDMKEKLKEGAMEKLGLSKAESAKGSEASAAPHEDTVELASSHPADASRVTPQDAHADDSVQPESTDEDKDEEKENAA